MTVPIAVMVRTHVTKPINGGPYTPRVLEAAVAVEPSEVDVPISPGVLGLQLQGYKAGGPPRIFWVPK
jgi:hypothetical protein